MYAVVRSPVHHKLKVIIKISYNAGQTNVHSTTVLCDTLFSLISNDYSTLVPWPTMLSIPLVLRMKSLAYGITVLYSLTVSLCTNRARSTCSQHSTSLKALLCLHVHVARAPSMLYTYTLTGVPGVPAAPVYS